MQGWPSDADQRHCKQEEAGGEVRRRGRSGDLAEKQQATAARGACVTAT
jgi:hypothetical protein